MNSLPLPPHLAWGRCLQACRQPACRPCCQRSCAACAASWACAPPCPPLQRSWSTPTPCKCTSVKTRQPGMSHCSSRCSRPQPPMPPVAPQRQRKAYAAADVALCAGAASVMQHQQPHTAAECSRLEQKPDTKLQGRTKPPNESDHASNQSARTARFPARARLHWEHASFRQEPLGLPWKHTFIRTTCHCCHLPTPLLGPFIHESANLRVHGPPCTLPLTQVGLALPAVSVLHSLRQATARGQEEHGMRAGEGAPRRQLMRGGQTTALCTRLAQRRGSLG